MAFRTRSERIDLAHNVVGGLFNSFSKANFRGPQWTVDGMHSIIESAVKIAALQNCIPDRHLVQMQRDALTFYKRHLEEPLKLIVELQAQVSP